MKYQMTMKKWMSTGILLILCTFVMAQDVKFGTVSQEELLEKAYPNDSSAAAAVLFRKLSTSYRYVQNDGFHVITQVQERIKIYSKDGFDYATVSENLYKSDRSKESMGQVRGFTYNLENGKVVKTKLKGSDTFNKSLNKYYNQETFTMPNVKEGSVIEYQYALDSPFSYNIDEIKLQYDIPIKTQKISVSTPEYYSFKPLMKGYLAISPQYSSTQDRINFVSRRSARSVEVQNTSFSTQTLNYRVNTTKFNMFNVPALKEEPYVNDMDNYRSAINFELQYIQFPNEPRESYTTTWEKVTKTIYDSDHFGRQLSYTKYFRDDLGALINGKNGNVEKAAAIFHHVQQRMTWNGYTGYFTDKGVKDAYKEKSGNIADINLMLVAMMKAADLKAEPVLISTRDNGVPLFPTREGFNYVVAAVELNGGIIFLDASNKYTKPNLLPTKALNWSGRLVMDDGTSSTVSVLPKKPSKETNSMSILMNADGSIEGKMRKTYTDYRAYSFRNAFNGVSEEDYLEKLENSNGGIEISNYDIKNKNQIGKPIMENCEFYLDGQVSTIGDKLYFTPLFHEAMTENPFKLEKRNYPIDFTYPWQEKYMLNITIPQGYQIESLPEGISMALENNMGSFRYQIVDKGNILQLIADLKINRAVISPQNYGGIQEFYKKIIEKEAEKVVLSKI